MALLWMFSARSLLRRLKPSFATSLHGVVHMAVANILIWLITVWILNPIGFRLFRLARFSFLIIFSLLAFGGEVVRVARRIKRNRRRLHAPARPLMIVPSEIWQDESGAISFWFEWEFVTDLQSGFLAAVQDMNR